MKTLLSLLFSLVYSSFYLGTTTQMTAHNLAITAKDAQSKNTLPGASVAVFSDLELVASGIVNAEGQLFLQVPPGQYQIQCTYTGYESVRFNGVEVADGAVTPVDFWLNANADLQEVVVMDYAISPRGETSEELSDLVIVEKTAGTTLSKAPVADRSVKASSAATKRCKEVPDARPSLTDDGSDKDYAKKEMPLSRKSDLATPPIEPPMPTPEVPAPKAGLLTAGEWNDLYNWSRHWKDLQQDGELDAYEKLYGFFPKNRYAVLLQNEQDIPIIDATIQLVDGDGKELWQCRTDNTGKAELWAGLYDGIDHAGLSLRALVKGKKYELGTAVNFQGGLNRHTIPTECYAPAIVDIVWAVDATGSMGDEIEYLKTELLDVISQVKNADNRLNIRMGSVFYRDNGDEYLVKSSELSPNISKTVEYISKQYAGGGGDYPEAVHSALEEAIYRQPWSSEAVTRICFLLLDASPHNTPEINASMQKSIREAAAKGIRIVPIVCSGIQKDTEFLMKFFGLATNGTYVFLTDHSGIGGKHLEPTSEEYKVEPLNSLLVRLLGEFTATETCEGKSTIRFQSDDPQQIPAWNALYYPNPAVDHITLELPVAVESVTFFDAEGKSVLKINNLREGTHTLQLQDLPNGFYTMRIVKGNDMKTGKIMVIRS